MIGPKYRVDILKNGKVFCEIEIGQFNSDESLIAVLERFPQEEGFEKSIFVSKGEKRFLESSDEGPKLLASVSDFQPMDAP